MIQQTHRKMILKNLRQRKHKNSKKLRREKMLKKSEGLPRRN